MKKIKNFENRDRFPRASLIPALGLLIGLLIFALGLNVVLAIHGLVTCVSWLLRAAVTGEYPKRIPQGRPRGAWRRFFPRGTEPPQTQPSTPKSRFRAVAWVLTQWNYTAWGQTAALFPRAIGAIIAFLILLPSVLIFGRPYPQVIFKLAEWLLAPFGGITEF